MARRKKPENETVEQATERMMFESIANHATRSEKTSWERKYKNITALVEKLQPIEEQILDLMTRKMPMMDEIMELRQEMVEMCIHPQDMLVTFTETIDGEDHTYVRCKFCERKLKAVTKNDA